MSDRAHHARPRWFVIVAALVIVVVLGVVVARLTLLRDQARGLPVAEVRDRFRSTTTTTTTTPVTTPATATPATTPPTTTPTTPTTATTATTATSDPPPLPAPGVYRYRTAGEESIDVLGGATHRYPTETTITVTPDGCGVLLRWDALVERRDEWRLCATPDGVELQTRGIQHHEFFGQPDTEDLVCDRTVVVVPVDPAAAPTRAGQSCMLAEDPWLPIWELLERGRRTVGDLPVDVQHVRMTIDDDDDYWEQTTVDWYLAGDGLPVAVSIDKSSRSPSPVGGVVYRETCELELLSTVPLT